MKMAPVTCAAFFICLAQLVVWLLPSWSNANAADSTSSFQLLHRNLPTICGCGLKKNSREAPAETHELQVFTKVVWSICQCLVCAPVCVCVYHNWCYVPRQFTHLPTSEHNLELKKPQSCGYKLNCIAFEIFPPFNSFELGSQHAQV